MCETANRRRLLLMILAVILLGLGAGAVDAPLARDAEAAAALGKQVFASAQCSVSKILPREQGLVVKGMSADALAAGCYRLHVPLAMAPLGDQRVSAIAITVKAGDAARALTMLNFAQAGEFTDITVDFTTTGGFAVPFEVNWNLTSEVARQNRKLTLEAPKGPEGEPGENDDFGDLNAPAPDAVIPRKELAAYSDYVAALPPYIEQLAPLQVAVTTDKVVYKPKEQGTATVTVRNESGTARTVRVSPAVSLGLDGWKPLAAATVEIPAGERRAVTVPFSADGLAWGAELRAVAQAEGGPAATGAAIFAVTDNFWETSITAGTNYTLRFHERAAAERFVTGARDAGYTSFESATWAPCNYLDFTPDDEYFFSGHFAYPSSITATKNYIELAHRNGMSTMVYAILGTGCGPSAIEVMREHPDWSSSGVFFTDWIEHWPLMRSKKLDAPNALWPVVWFNDNPEIQEYHARELIATHKQFGWDAVRYDVWDINSGPQVKATVRVHDLVKREAPDFRWGYNSDLPSKGVPEALPLLNDGGMFMFESPRMISKGGGSLAGYLANALDYRDAAWPKGGHYGICYDQIHEHAAAENGISPTQLDAVYVSSLLLAAGAHPFYGRLAASLGDYPRFALRYAEYLWDNRLRPLPNPEAVIHPEGTPAPLEWKRLAGARDLGGNRHRLVIHLINPPANNNALHNPAMKTPPPLRDYPLTLTLPADAAVTGAWQLSPAANPTHTPLTPRKAGQAIEITVPEVRFWTVVVVEYTSGQSFLK